MLTLIIPPLSSFNHHLAYHPPPRTLVFTTICPTNYSSGLINPPGMFLKPRNQRQDLGILSGRIFWRGVRNQVSSSPLLVIVTSGRYCLQMTAFRIFQSQYFPQRAISALLRICPGSQYIATAGHSSKSRQQDPLLVYLGRGIHLPSQEFPSSQPWQSSIAECSLSSL